ncbi:hypothetical protein D3C71_2039510 [compost metagenome]
MKYRHGMDHQLQRFQQRLGDQWNERIQFQLSGCRSKRYGRIIGYNPHRDAPYHLGDDGIDLAGHDGGTCLYRRELVFAYPSIRSGIQQPEVARNL